MDRILAKYKVSLSLVSLILIVVWVWGVATLVNTKENKIYKRLDLMELSLVTHTEKIMKLQMQTKQNEENNAIIRADIQMIRHDLTYIRSGIEKLWDRYDHRPESHEMPVPQFYTPPSPRRGGE